MGRGGLQVDISLVVGPLSHGEKVAVTAAQKLVRQEDITFESEIAKYILRYDLCSGED